MGRRIGVGALGGSLVALGLVMVVTPGPALIVLPAGIGVLALEFEWAQRLKQRARQAIASRKL